MTSSRSAGKPPGQRSAQGSVVVASSSGVLAAVDGPWLHPRLDELLRSVQAAERAAVGEHRRPTFKLMRELLAAAIHLGVPGHLLADCLGTSTGAVRNRAQSSEGTITAELVQRLTGLTPRELGLSHGGLTRAAEVVSDLGSDSAAGNDDTYRIVDVVRALLDTPRTENP